MLKKEHGLQLPHGPDRGMLHVSLIFPLCPKQKRLYSDSNNNESVATHWILSKKRVDVTPPSVPFGTKSASQIVVVVTLSKCP